MKMVGIIIGVVFLSVMLIVVIFFPVWLSHRQWKRDFNNRVKKILERNKKWNEEFFSSLEQSAKRLKNKPRNGV